MKPILLTLLFLPFLCKAQIQFSKWCFGNNIGLIFNSTVTTFTNYTSSGPEGVSNLCNASGNVIMYSNGYEIRNQTGAVMANGNLLLGNTSAAQGVLATQLPGSQNLYYIFTVRDYQLALPSALRYNVIDMTLAAGLGSVTVKNATLQNINISSECIAGARHCNGTDVWIIIRPYKDQSFYSYLLSSTGISTTAVVSNPGLDSIHWRGALKISQSGKRIAYVAKDDKVVVADFDNSSGMIGGNSIVLQGYYDPYGLEFSPDGTKLYASTGPAIPTPANPQAARKVYQWDLCAGSQQAINNSRYLLHSDSTTFAQGALQLAINGKIYKARTPISDSIGVINFPNLAGAACVYNNKGQSTGGQISGAGLPNFVSGYMRSPQTPFSYTANCQSVQFTGMPGQQICAGIDYSVNAVSWNFGDPNSLAQNTSTVVNTNHYFSAPGTYSVQFIVTRQCRIDTVKQTIVIPAASPSITISGKVAICAKESTTLNAAGATSYLWSTNSTQASIAISPTVNTQYTVTTTNSVGCTASKVVTVTVSKCTSIIDANAEQVLRVFPNPSNGQITILSTTAGTLKILDLSGRVVYEASFYSGERNLDISALGKGLYFLQMHYSTASSTQKIIIE